MKNFKIQLFNGHPIIIDGVNVILIDTGAPSSIHTSSTLEFCSETFECTTNYMGITIAKISEMLGTEITTLLGADILSNFKILLDYKDELAVFSKEEIDFHGTEVGISNFMGIPIISMFVDNQNLKLFLDTGAKLSYLPNSITSKYENIGSEEDFYPGVGNFTTECYKIPGIFCDVVFSARYGNLPKLLQMTLMLGGTDGIIGFDFFNNFKVMLDLKNNRMKYYDGFDMNIDIDFGFE